MFNEVYNVPLPRISRLPVRRIKEDEHIVVIVEEKVSVFLICNVGLEEINTANLHAPVVPD